MRTIAVTGALGLLCLANPGEGQENGFIACRAVATDRPFRQSLFA